MLPARRRFLGLAALGAAGVAGRAAAGARAVQPAIPRAGHEAARDAAARRPAPIAWRDVTLLDGTILRASHLTGAPVVVEFWASWCPFCARQNPELQALWQRVEPLGLRVLTFSIDKDPAAARRYMANHRYTFAAAMASAQSRRWFGERHGLPMLYVVGADGRIVAQEAGEMFPEDVAALARFAPARGSS